MDGGSLAPRVIVKSGDKFGLEIAGNLLGALLQSLDGRVDVSGEACLDGREFFADDGADGLLVLAGHGDCFHSTPLRYAWLNMATLLFAPQPLAYARGSVRRRFGAANVRERMRNYL